MKYRNDIDGLRGIAVMIVILNHVSIACFTGGYVGVDVFFVISGYVISSTICKDISCGTFTIIGFYERRIRRLLPGLALTSLLTGLYAYFVFLPQDLISFSQSAAAVSIGASNFVFWRQSGYFDESAVTKPLLHTWSLAVEEQFYLVFPFALAKAYRYAAGLLLPGLVAIAALSFYLSVLWSYSRPSLAFYLLPTRIWELGLGAILFLASGNIPKLTGLFRSALSVAGLLLILAPTLMYDDHTRFPGFAAIPPTFGAIALIFAGDEHNDSAVTRLLTCTPLLFTGRLSYLLYLVHWPIIVFVRYYTFNSISFFYAMFVLLASFAAAILIYVLFEQPIRARRLFPGSRGVYGAAVGYISVSFIFAIAASITHGFPNRFEERLAQHRYNVREMSQDHGLMKDVFPYSNGVPIDHGYVNPEKTCFFGQDGPADIVVWGDSHAGHLLDGVIAEASGRHHKIKLFVNFASPPALELSAVNVGGRDYNRRVVEIITRDDTIKHVIISANWSLYLHGTSHGVFNRPSLKFMDEDVPATEITAVFRRQLKETVLELLRSGRKVYLLEPIPDYDQNVSRAIDVCEILGKSVYDVIDCSKARFEFRQGEIISDLRDIANATGAVAIPLFEAFWNGDRFVVEQGGVGLYSDNHHLTPLGSRRAAAFIFDRLDLVE